MGDKPKSVNFCYESVNGVNNMLRASTSFESLAGPLFQFSHYGLHLLMNRSISYRMNRK